MHVKNVEKSYIMIINKIRNTVEKLETSLKHSRDLEAVRSLRYFTLKLQNKILTDELKKTKINNKEMLSEQKFFKESVTDIQLDSMDMLPETLKRQVQRSWHQKYDALLSQNERLKKKIIALDLMIIDKEKQIDVLQRRLLSITGSVIIHEENTEKICKKCWIIRNNV